MSNIIILVIWAQFWMTLGHILFKKSTNNGTAYNLGNQKSGIANFFIDLLQQPFFWGGIITMTIGLLSWFAALAVGELNLVYALGSLQYIFILCATPFFLNERIDFMKLMGTVMVTLGIIFVTLS